MSYITVTSDKILAACDAYLTDRQRRIDAEREALVLQEMSRWLFRAKTREQAISRLEAGPPFSAWSNIAVRGGYWAGIAEALRKLAQHAPEVHVDDEHCFILNWIKEPS